MHVLKVARHGFVTAIILSADVPQECPNFATVSGTASSAWAVSFRIFSRRRVFRRVLSV
jgi:hypothetical protein